MDVMQKLIHLSGRTSSKIMSLHYPRWRTNAEEVIITADES